MNKFKFSLILIFISIFNCRIKAQDENQIGPDDTNILSPEVNPSRKKAPSKQRVTCHRFENNLALWLTVPEGWCHLIVEDENMNTAVFTFDSSELEFETTLSNMKGRLYLTLTTQTGRTYSGTLN